MSQELVKYAWMSDTQPTHLMVTTIEDYTEDDDSPFEAFQFTYPIIELTAENRQSKQKVGEFIAEGGSEDRKFTDEDALNTHFEELENKAGIYVFENEAFTINDLVKFLLNSDMARPPKIPRIEPMKEL